MSTVDDVLALAAGQIGTTEVPPDSNHVLYSEWYAQQVGDPSFGSGPWCAMFVSWVFAQAGQSGLVAAQGPAGFAYCPSGLRWFAGRGRLTSYGRRGDLVFYDWQHDGVPDHVGIVESVRGDGSIVALEGNTSAGELGSQSNGGGVFRRVRSMSTVRAFGSPSYGDQAPADPPVLQLGSQGPEVLQWQLTLQRWDPQALPQSGADGDFGPETDAATRRLQAAAGVLVDGQVGPLTRAAADRLLGPTVLPGSPVPPLHGLLQLGSVGPDVKLLQARLAERGWAITADGEYGPITCNVVRQYQAEKQLVVDGVVGPQTWSSVFLAPVTR